MGYPAIHTATCGNQYFHVMTFARVGDHIPTHEHTYDHVMQILAGSARVTSDAREDIAKAGDLVDIPAGVAHGITALEDGTVAQCVHILRWPDGTIVPFSYKLTPIERLELTGAL